MTLPSRIVRSICIPTSGVDPPQPGHDGTPIRQEP
jgi:hypothetical protein